MCGEGFAGTRNRAARFLCRGARTALFLASRTRRPRAHCLRRGRRRGTRDPQTAARAAPGASDSCCQGPRPRLWRTGAIRNSRATGWRLRGEGGSQSGPAGPSGAMRVFSSVECVSGKNLLARYCAATDPIMHDISHDGPLHICRYIGEGVFCFFPFSYLPPVLLFCF